MIGVISSLVLAVYTKSYVPLIGIAVWLIGIRNRDAGLVSYLLYVLYLSNHIPIPTVYAYTPLVEALAAALTMILLLEDVLTGGLKRDTLEVASSAMILGGVVFPEVVLAVGLFYLAVRLKPGILELGITGTLVAGAILLRSNLDVMGGAPLQAGLLSAFGIFLLLPGVARRKLKKSGMH